MCYFLLLTHHIKEGDTKDCKEEGGKINFFFFFFTLTSTAYLSASSVTDIVFEGWFSEELNVEMCSVVNLSMLPWFAAYFSK